MTDFPYDTTLNVRFLGLQTIDLAPLMVETAAIVPTGD